MERLIDAMHQSFGRIRRDRTYRLPSYRNALTLLSAKMMFVFLMRTRHRRKWCCVVEVDLGELEKDAL